jgi:hypothetical protein
VAFEKRALGHVKVPVGYAQCELAERIRRDVYTAGGQTVTLHRREGSIAPGDLSDRIVNCHALSSLAVVGRFTDGFHIPST